MGLLSARTPSQWHVFGSTSEHLPALHVASAAHAGPLVDEPVKEQGLPAGAAGPWTHFPEKPSLALPSQR